MTLQFERLAFDTNAAVDSLRPDRPFPLPLRAARQLFMPLMVLAELRPGASRSRHQEENARAVDALDMHDIWIAAVALQHKLPLLTNDAFFREIEGIEVVTW